MDEIEFYLIDLKSRFDGIDPKKYYLSYSGGKDSHFLYWFIKEYLHDTEIEIVGVNTYMEHSQILKRIIKNCDVVLLPKMKPFEIKEKYGSPCFSKWQDEMIDRYQKGSRTQNTMGAITGENRTVYKLSNKARNYTLSGNAHRVSNKCCKIIKKDTLKDYEKQSKRKAIIGVRGNESIIRKQQYKTCFTKKGNFTPLHDLSDELLDAIYKKYDIEIPSIYKHISRTGCMGCPYGSFKKRTQIELRLINKNQRKFLGKLFGESYKVLGIDIEAIKKDCGDYE